MPPKKVQVAKSRSSSKDNGSAEPSELVENRTSRSQMSRDKRTIDVTIEEEMEEVLTYKGYYCRKHKTLLQTKPKSSTDIDLPTKYRSLDQQSLDNQRSIARRNQVSDDKNEDIIKSTITLAGNYTFEKLSGIKLAKQVDELRKSVKYIEFSESNNKEVTIAGTNKEKIFVVGERLKRWATAPGILAPRLACTFVAALNPNQLLHFTKSRTGNQYFLSLKEEQAVLFEMDVPFAVPKLLMVGHAELPQGQVPKVDITFGRLVFEDGAKRLADLSGSHVNSLNELKVGTGGDITRKFYNSLPNQITEKVLHTLGELYGTPNLIKEFMIEVTDALVPDTIFVYKIKEDRTESLWTAQKNLVRVDKLNSQTNIDQVLRFTYAHEVGPSDYSDVRDYIKTHVKFDCFKKGKFVAYHSEDANMNGRFVVQNAYHTGTCKYVSHQTNTTITYTDELSLFANKQNHIFNIESAELNDILKLETLNNHVLGTLTKCVLDMYVEASVILRFDQ